MITVVIVSFHSQHLILDRIKEIGTNVPIIIVENSKDTELKKKIESQYSNVKVQIPERNLGWGKAVNLAINESKTDYIYLIQPDIILLDDCIKKLIDCLSEFNDFAILTPININQKDHKNYATYVEKNKAVINNKYDLEEVDHVDLSWVLNKKEIKDIDYWDENIFLYYETFDLCKRLRDKNKKIYISKNIKTSHLGSKSHTEHLQFQSLLNRNWHYNWSKFYYFKKHHGYFFGLKKTFPNLIRSLKKYISCRFFSKNHEYKLYYAEISGLISSYLKKPASYRPYEKK